MDLFIQPDVRIEKLAAAVDLPEDPNAWPKEILDELYKQVPYIADFHPHVEMSKVNPERAYGLGHVLVANQPPAQPENQFQSANVEMQQMMSASLRSIRIPIIIKDGKLAPFDLFINDSGKVIPLTESRLRQALFRPQMFDITSDTPGDQSTINQLYPPNRQSFGYGSGAMQMAKMGSVLEEYLIKELEKTDPGFRRPATVKTACGTIFHKTASLLKEIAPTMLAADQDAFCSALNRDPGLRAGFHKNAAATQAAVRTILTADPYSAEKTASVLAHVKPSVVQITKEANGYAVKTANRDFWNPKVEHVHRGELVMRFGEKIALATDQAGGVTLGQGGVAEEPETRPMEPCTQPGTYRVFDVEGKELIGTVIPNLIDLDGETVPLTLFTNGSQATVQGEIFGAVASQEAALPEGPVGGTGAFFSMGPEGLVAIIPMTLESSYAMPEQPSTFSGETYDGRPVEVSVQPNIQMPTATGEGKLIIPETWRWTSLEGASQVSLAGGPEAPPDMSPEKMGSHVQIRSDGSTFSFSGPAIEKVAQDERSFVDLDGAMFLLAALGVDQGYGVTKLAHALSGSRPETLRVGHSITPAQEVTSWAYETAREKIASLPKLKKDLIKEAALIADPMAVDTVLSLGFINDENMMTFVSYLPTIDDSQLKMCELLLATRLGVSEVQEAALERAIRATEEVLEGLRTIAFQGT